MMGALPASYDSLFSRTGNDTPFGTRRWYESFERILVDHKEQARIYGVDESEGQQTARALLPMVYGGTKASLLSVRRLRSLSNYYTSLFEPVLGESEADAPALIDSIVAQIAGESPAWDEVDLHPLAVESSTFAAFVTAFRQRGMLVQPYFCFGNWYLEVAGRSYTNYFGSLPSQLRNTVRRKSKQFAAAPGARIQVYRSVSEVDAALADYEKVYATSWKVPEPYPEFIREICRTWAQWNWLRLGIAYLGDQPAAAQIWIVHGTTASIFKLAYDERYAKQSIGSVLTAHLMEEAIDVDKVDQIDYLTGDDSYKRDWMSHRRERWGIRAINPRTPRGLMSATRHLGAQAAKRLTAALRRSSPAAIPTNPN